MSIKSEFEPLSDINVPECRFLPFKAVRRGMSAHRGLRRGLSDAALSGLICAQGRCDGADSAVQEPAAAPGSAGAAANAPGMPRAGCCLGAACWPWADLGSYLFSAVCLSHIGDWRLPGIGSTGLFPNK